MCQLPLTIFITDIFEHHQQCIISFLHNMTSPKQIVIQKRNGKDSHNIRKELRCHFFIFCNLIFYSVIYNHAEKVKEFSSVEKIRSSQSLKDQLNVLKDRMNERKEEIRALMQKKNAGSKVQYFQAKIVLFSWSTR